MRVFLLVTAGVFAGMFLFAVVANWWVRRKISSFMGDISDVVDGLVNGMGMMPALRIQLKPASNVIWHHPADIAAATDLLKREGFQDAGQFLPEGKPQVVMGLFVHPDEHLAAILMDPKNGMTCMDIAATYADGHHRFFTNTQHDGLDKPEWTDYQRMPDATMGELLAAARKGLPTGGRQPINGNDLPGWIEQVYEREQFWRINRGGYTDQEIERTITAGGNEVTEESVDMTKLLLQGALANAVEEELKKRFFETGTLPATKRNELEGRLIFIHPMTDADAIMEHLDRLFKWNIDDQYDDETGEPIEGSLRAVMQKSVEQQLKTQKPWEVFAALASQAPETDGFEHLADITDPVDAAVYALPPWDDDDEYDDEDDDDNW